MMRKQIFGAHGVSNFARRELWNAIECKIRQLICCIAWPGLMVLCMAIMAYGFTHGRPVPFNVAYVILIVTLFFLERWMPHERSWSKPDGQTLAGAAHEVFHAAHRPGRSAVVA